MFNWLFTNRRMSAPVTPKSAMKDLAMKASIAAKLRNYNADEDSTISEFSLADDKKDVRARAKITPVTGYDVWGQANPGETGKWKKEIRRERSRIRVGRDSTSPRWKKV